MRRARACGQWTLTRYGSVDAGEVLAVPPLQIVLVLVAILINSSSVLALSGDGKEIGCRLPVPEYFGPINYGHTSGSLCVWCVTAVQTQRQQWCTLQSSVIEYRVNLFAVARLQSK